MAIPKEKIIYVLTIKKTDACGGVITERQELPDTYSREQADAIAKAYKSLPDVRTVMLEAKVIITQTNWNVLSIY